MPGSFGFYPSFRISNQHAVDVMMQRYDLDKNGTLNIDEAQNVPILSRENFDTADSLGDGKLTEKEFVSYIDQMKMDLAGNGAAGSSFLVQMAEPVTNATFSRILADADNSSGKLQFMNYMNKLTGDYDTAVKRGEYLENGKLDFSA